MAWNRIEAERQQPHRISGTKHDGGPKLHNLQVVRAIAALSVVVAHAIHETINLAAATGQPAIEANALNLGYGVDIFFVLSGFIMMHTAATEFGKTGAPAQFFLRRCARVVPLYWLLTSILLLGAAIAPSLLQVPIGNIAHILASYLFIPDGRGADEIRPVLALGWTLNYEMLFYVFFALALLLPIRLGVVWLSTLMVGLALVGTMISPRYVQISFWTSPIILEFLYGVFVALIFRAGFRLAIGPALALAAIGLLGFIRISTPWDDTALPQFLRCGLPAASFVLAAALGPPLPLNRLVLWSVALGDASYSLYLSHPFIVKPLRAIWVKIVGGHLPAGFLVACSAIIAIVLALSLYRWVEKPMTSQVQRLVRISGRPGEKQRLQHPSA